MHFNQLWQWFWNNNFICEISVIWSITQNIVQMLQFTSFEWNTELSLQFALENMENVLKYCITPTQNYSHQNQCKILRLKRSLLGFFKRHRQLKCSNKEKYIHEFTSHFHFTGLIDTNNKMKRENRNRCKWK